jgi:hypothetical protein
MDNCSATQEIWQLGNVRNCVHKIPVLESVVSLLNQFHIHPNIDFNIVFSRLGYTRGFSSSVSRTKVWETYFILRLSLCNLFTLMISGEENKL